MFKKEVNAEINLVPFISLLSVLICSLLLSAVWINLGSVDVKQSMGATGKSVTAKEPTLWARVMPNGSVRLKVDNAPKRIFSRKLSSIVKATEEKTPDTEQLLKVITQVKEKIPKLNVALIRPEAKTKYDYIIQVMDVLKGQSINDLGIVPL